MLESIHELSGWVASWANTPYGGLALGLIAFAESSFFPIPPDVLLIAMCLIDPERSFLYAGICTAGSVTGGSFGYGLGRVGGRPLVKRLFAEAKVLLVQHYYQRYDVWAVAVAGFTPIPYKVFTITAGTFLLDFKRFMLASLVGRAGRFFLVGTLFFFFGETIGDLIRRYLNLFSIAFVVLLIAGFWAIHWWTKKKVKVLPGGASMVGDHE